MQKLRYNKTFKDGMLLLVTLFLVSIALIVFPIVSKIQYDNLVSNMKSVEATIVDIDLDLHLRGPDEQEIYIIYEVDGVVYNRELSTDTKISFSAGTAANYSIGDTIEIFYNPQNPNEIATQRSVNVGYGVLILGLIFFALLLFAFILMLKNRQKFLVSREEYEKEKRKRKNSHLESKSGRRIRWQYFNTYIFIQLSFIPAVPIMIILSELKKGNFDIWSGLVEMSGATPFLLAFYSIFIGPFIILSVLNRFWFGKVLGVVDNSTLFLSDSEIDVNDIIEIIYHPRLMSRSKFSSCFATFVVQSKNGVKESFDVLHFPLYGLKEIKKYNPNIKIGFDKYIWILPLSPTAISVVIGLLLG